MLTAFAKRIAPRWKLISATVNGDDVLVLYQIFTPDDRPATCADYFTIRSGKIQSEILAFDPAPFQPR